MRAVQQPEQTDSGAKRESGAVLAALRDRAQRILAHGPYEASDPVTRALEVIADLEPGFGVLARRAHEQLRDSIADALQSCGEVDEDLVSLVNGLKEFAEERPWAYQNGHWETTHVPAG